MVQCMWLPYTLIIHPRVSNYDHHHLLPPFLSNILSGRQWRNQGRAPGVYTEGSVFPLLRFSYQQFKKPHRKRLRTSPRTPQKHLLRATRLQPTNPTQRLHQDRQLNLQPVYLHPFADYERLDRLLNKKNIPHLMCCENIRCRWNANENFWNPSVI